MNTFLQRHRASVMGMLQGFDRLRLRGTLRPLAYVGGMMGYLWSIGVLLKGFKEYAVSVTEQIRRTTERVAEAAQRPVEYLASSSVRKEHVAREIARRDGIDEGLICVLTCVEPCWSYQIRINALKSLAMNCGPLSEMILGCVSGKASRPRCRMISISRSFIASRISQCTRYRLNPSKTLHR